MRNTDQAPIRTHNENGLTETTETHPAFAQIAASRVSGGTVLYGSDFVHHNFVEIVIKRSERHRSLSNDWHFPREEMISVRLSEAQWATFVSTLNGGGGTPCTLIYKDRERMPTIPLEPRQDLYRDEAEASVKKLVTMIDGTIDKVLTELGTSLSTKKRDAILGELRMLRQQIHSNVPFVAKQFAEHMEDTVEKAKIEVHAYMENAVRSMGLDAINAPARPLLMSGPTDDANPGT